MVVHTWAAMHDQGDAENPMVNGGTHMSWNAWPRRCWESNDQWWYTHELPCMTTAMLRIQWSMVVHTWAAMHDHGDAENPMINGGTHMSCHAWPRRCWESNDQWYTHELPCMTTAMLRIQWSMVVYTWCHAWPRRCWESNDQWWYTHDAIHDHGDAENPMINGGTHMMPCMTTAMLRIQWSMVVHTWAAMHDHGDAENPMINGGTHMSCHAWPRRCWESQWSMVVYTWATMHDHGDAENPMINGGIHMMPCMTTAMLRIQWSMVVHTWAAMHDHGDAENPMINGGTHMSCHAWPWRCWESNGQWWYTHDAMHDQGDAENPMINGGTHMSCHAWPRRCWESNDQWWYTHELPCMTTAMLRIQWSMVVHTWATMHDHGDAENPNGQWWYTHELPCMTTAMLRIQWSMVVYTWAAMHDHGDAENPVINGGIHMMPCMTRAMLRIQWSMVVYTWTTMHDHGDAENPNGQWWYTHDAIHDQGDAENPMINGGIHMSYHAWPRQCWESQWSMVVYTWATMHDHGDAENPMINGGIHMSCHAWPRRCWESNDQWWYTHDAMHDHGDAENPMVNGGIHMSCHAWPWRCWESRSWCHILTANHVQKCLKTSHSMLPLFVHSAVLGTWSNKDWRLVNDAGKNAGAFPDETVQNCVPIHVHRVILIVTS